MLCSCFGPTCCIILFFTRNLQLGLDSQMEDGNLWTQGKVRIDRIDFTELTCDLIYSMSEKPWFLILKVFVSILWIKISRIPFGFDEVGDLKYGISQLVWEEGY